MEVEEEVVAAIAWRDDAIMEKEEMIMEKNMEIGKKQLVIEEKEQVIFLAIQQLVSLGVKPSKIASTLAISEKEVVKVIRLKRGWLGWGGEEDFYW